MKAIVNGKIYLNNKFINDKVIIFEEKIIDIIDKANFDSNNYEEVIDAKNNLILPGLIDVHIHGYSGYDTMDNSYEALKEISNNILKNGVTSFLPTTMTMDKETILSTLNTIKDFKDSNKDGANVLGVHLEGPFINSKYKGAQNGINIIKPDTELFKEYEEMIKIITVAPEEDEDMSFIREMTNRGINISIGHTGADYDTALKAYKNGAKGITHTFNAMTGLHHRNPGVLGAALNNDFYCEFICDNIHFNKVLYNMILKTKKQDKIVIITDCMRAGGMPEGDYELGGQKVIMKDGKCLLVDGTIAGSTSKLNKGLNNFVENSDISLEEAVKFATENPAKYINEFDKRGSLDKGKYSDIIITNEDVEVLYTIKEGRVLYHKED